MFDVFLWMTLQIQFVIPGMVMDVGMTLFFTHGYLTRSPPPTPPLLPLYSPTW